MKNNINAVGMKFYQWTVIGKKTFERGRIRWECICVCGNRSFVRYDALRNGRSKSCGCLPRKTKHGMTKTLTYRTWINMLERCTNPKIPTYKRYGARGIKVCNRWKIFNNFYADMGKKPIHMSLDRIDNNKDYSPENCKWSTRSDQQNNKRSNVRFTYNGQTLTLEQWSKKLNINRELLRYWLQRKNKPITMDMFMAQKLSSTEAVIPAESRSNSELKENAGPNENASTNF